MCLEITSLRKYLLEGDIDKVQELLSEVSDPEEIYNFLCEFYTECDVKDVYLHEKIRKFIIGYVVKYRLDYVSENKIENDSYRSENVSKRVELLKDLINYCKDKQYLNPFEIITFLKSIARVIRPLSFDKNAPALPWGKIQFVVCIFIATKSDKARLPNWLVDNYYQLMVTEESVVKLLRQLLSRLEDVEQKAVDWSELDDVFNISKMYYLVLKMYWQLRIFEREFPRYPREKKQYCLQGFGECLVQIIKLNYTGFEDSSYMSQKMNLFSTILVQERHKLSHSQKTSFDKVNINKFISFVLELIQIVRSKIEDKLLKEFQTVLANSVDQLLERVNQISITCFSWEKYENLKIWWKIYNILNDFNDKNHLVVVFDIGIKLLNIFELPNYENEVLFNFIKRLKKESEISKEETQLSEGIITKLMNQISPQPFVNIKTLLDLFLGFVPDSPNREYLVDWCTNLKSDYIMDEPKNADDEAFIQDLIKEIEESIEDEDQKRKFAEIVSKLMKERCDFYESKNFKNSNVENRRLRNNPIQTILKNKYNNLSTWKIAEIFLKEIKWKYVNAIIAKMRKEKPNHTSVLSDEIDEMYIFDSFESVKKDNFTNDFNFLDFDSPIPVGKNMRNYLAHGDICIDVLCPDILLAVKEHNNFFGHFHDNQERILGFSRPDDFDLVRNNFMKQMCWAREAWELLNWKNDRKVLEKYKSDPMAFRIRDPAGLSIIQYSLKEVKESSEFLDFLISKLLNEECEKDILFEKLYNSYVPFYLNDLNKMRVELFWEIDNEILDCNSVSSYVNDLYDHNKGLALAQILCFNCPDIANFKRLFDKIEIGFPWDKWLYDEINNEFDSYCGLLQIAVAQNQKEIVKFLLNNDNFKQLVNSQYKNFTALQYAVMNGNIEMASILIDNGANINQMSKRYDYRMHQVLNVFKGDGLPLSMALPNGDPEMLSLVKPKEMHLDNNIIFDIQRKIKMNSNPEMWNCLLNSFCETKKDFEMFLHIACINEKFDIVKIIIENKPLDWNSVKETILISCCNLKSKEILEYLLNKEAVLKLEHIKLICTFGSMEVVEFLIANDHLKRFLRNDLIGRNKEIVEALLKANCKIDWNAVDFLILQFIREQNTSREFIPDRITYLLMHSSSQTQLVKQLKAMGIRIPLSVLEYASTELKSDKCNWLKECEFVETTEGWNRILETAVMRDHYLLARIALKRGANINISIDNRTLLDFYIKKNQGKVSEMMKLLSEFKCPSHYKFDFNNFTIQDQLLFGYLTKNEDMIRNTEGKADLGFKYSNFRDGTILHILYHYGIKLGTKEEESSIKNLDNCTSFDLLVLNNPFRPLPSHFSEISPFQRLIAGILRSNFEVMKDALENGADINSVLDHYNLYSPLHVAVMENLTSVVDFLLLHGSNPYQTDSYQKFPIESSILSFDNNSMVELLLQNMTLTNDEIDYLLEIAKTKQRKKVLKTIIGTKSHNLKTRSDFETALKRGLNINSVPDEYLETYLHIASYNSDFELVQFLLQNGANPVVKNYFFELPIDLAVEKDDTSIVDLFLKHHLQSYNLDGLLEIAFKSNSVKTAEVLFERGAKASSYLLKYPCEMPNESGFELARIFFEFQEGFTLYVYYFDQAVVNSNYILAQSLLSTAYLLSNIILMDIIDFEAALKEGINIYQCPKLNFPIDNEISYLLYAIFCCESNVVEFLLQNGANHLSRYKLNYLPIEYAILLDDVEKVRLLFERMPHELKERNFPVFTRSETVEKYNLRELLLLATESNSLKSLEFLLENGLEEIKNDLTIIDYMLEISCSLKVNKGLKIVKHILDIKLKSPDLMKLLDISKQENNFEVANLLISIINKDSCNEEPLSLSAPYRSSDNNSPLSRSSSSSSSSSFKPSKPNVESFVSLCVQQAFKSFGSDFL